MARHLIKINHCTCGVRIKPGQEFCKKCLDFMNLDAGYSDDTKEFDGGFRKEYERADGDMENIHFKLGVED